jgi:hypothetical protein
MQRLTVGVGVLVFVGLVCTRAAAQDIPGPPSNGSMTRRSGFATSINLSINAILRRTKSNADFLSSRPSRLQRIFRSSR